VPKLIVVVDVLVTQRDSEDALLDEFLNAVLDQFRIAVVGETLRKTLQQSELRFEFSQQQTADVRRD